MTLSEKTLVSLIGRKNKSPEQLGFINTMFHRAYNKKKNVLKRVVKKASAHDVTYGWTE